jgi:hypothetical protein
LTSLLELGLATFLTAFLAENETSAAVHDGTSNAVVPPNDPVIIVSVRECAHDVGPLYRGMLDVIVSTPAIAGKTVEDHRILVAVVEDAFDPGNNAEVSAATQASAHCTVNGWFYQGPKDSQANDRWNTTMSYVLGVERMAN